MRIKIDIGVVGEVHVDFKSIQWRYCKSKRKNRGKNNKGKRELNAVFEDVQRCSEMIVDVTEE